MHLVTTALLIVIYDNFRILIVSFGLIFLDLHRMHGRRLVGTEMYYPVLIMARTLTN